MARRRDSLVKAVVGKLGSGKTWFSVMKMVDALMCGQVVVSNVELNWPAVEAYCKKQKVTVPRKNYRYVPTAEIAPRPAVLLEYLDDEGSCLVIDEVHLFLNARLWKENQDKAQDFLNFLTQARKVNVDCYLITQDERNADAQLLRMCTHVVRVVNWRHVPFLGHLFPFNLTIGNICNPDGKTRVGREWIWRGGGIGNLYNSRQRHSDLQLTGEKAGRVIGKRQESMSYGMTLGLVGLAIVMFDGFLRWRGWLWYASAGLMDSGLPSKAEGAGRAVSSPTSSPVGPRAVGDQMERSEPVRPVECSRDEVARIEQTLPGIYKVTPWNLVLFNHGLLRPGSWFVDGYVIGWNRLHDCVEVNLDSKRIPKVRLFYGTRSKPVIYVSESDGARRSAWGNGGNDTLHLPHSPGVADGGVTRVEPYQAPQAFIPEGTGGGASPLQLGERVGFEPIKRPPPKIPAWPASALGNVRP